MTYKVGLVGCGGMGRLHLRVIREHLPEFAITALCDVSPESAAQIKEEFELQVRYQSFEEMYDGEELDLVVVATQTRGHHAPTVAALERGISVLCEKPIAIDLVEADEMVEAAEKSGAKLAINQQNHVNPSVRRAQEMIQQGAIGEVITVRGRNKAGRKSGNEFTEMGTHVADMMRCFGGTSDWCAGTVYYEGRPATVADIMEAKEMSSTDRDSGPVLGSRAIGHYGFPGGILGEVHFIDYETTNNRNYGIDILGTDGQLAVRIAVKADFHLWHLPRPMEGAPSDYGDWQAVDLGSAGDQNAIATMYRELMRAHAEGTEPPGSGAEGRLAFEMILGIYESHRREGRRVSLPLEERRHPLEMWRLET